MVYPIVRRQRQRCIRDRTYPTQKYLCLTQSTTARGTGPRKSSHLSLDFSDLFVIQGKSRDKRRFCKSAPPAVREAACQSLRTCSPSQTGALQTTTLGILPLFVQANSRVLSNAGDSDGQNSNFMQAGDSDGRGDGQKPCFQSASNCAASKSLSC